MWSDRGWARARNDEASPRPRSNRITFIARPEFTLTGNASPFRNVDLQKSFRFDQLTLFTTARYNHKQNTLAYAASLKVRPPS